MTAGLVAGSMTSANAFASASPSSTVPQVRPSLATAATSVPVANTFVAAPTPAPAQQAPAPQAQAPVQEAPAQPAPAPEAPAPAVQPAAETVQTPWAQQDAAGAVDVTATPEAAPVEEAAPAPVEPWADQQPADQAPATVQAGTDVAAEAPIETVPAVDATPVQDQAGAAPADTTASADALAGQATQVEPVVSTTDTVTGSRAQIVQDGLAGVGGAYVWGGHDYMAWDCSGFVSYVYGQSGIQLDPYTYSMAEQLTPTAAPQAGDVVFTNNYAHVGIYLGDGQMVSALNPEQGTQVTAVDGGGMMTVDGYYSSPALG